MYSNYYRSLLLYTFKVYQKTQKIVKANLRLRAMCLKYGQSQPKRAYKKNKANSHKSRALGTINVFSNCTLKLYS